MHYYLENETIEQAFNRLLEKYYDSGYNTHYEHEQLFDIGYCEESYFGMNLNNVKIKAKTLFDAIKKLEKYTYELKRNSIDPPKTMCEHLCIANVYIGNLDNEHEREESMIEKFIDHYFNNDTLWLTKVNIII